MKKILIAVGIVALLVVCWRWSAAIPQDLDPLMRIREDSPSQYLER